MFKFVVTKTDLFKKVFGILDDLNQDLNIELSPKGISIQAMDSSHVVLTNVRFDKDFFTEYELDKNTILGIKVSSVLRVLDCVGSDVICVEFSDERPDKFVISSENAHFELNTIDLDTEEMEIPEMDVDVVITAESSIIQKYFKNFSAFGDTITFDTDENDVRMSSRGDIGIACMKLAGSTIEITGKLKAEFALRYLITFSKASGISKTVVIKMLSEFPAQFEYQFDTNSYIKFFLAPKFTEED